MFRGVLGLRGDLEASRRRFGRWRRGTGTSSGVYSGSERSRPRTTCCWTSWPTRSTAARTTPYGRPRRWCRPRSRIARGRLLQPVLQLGHEQRGARSAQRLQRAPSVEPRLHHRPTATRLARSAMAFKTAATFAIRTIRIRRRARPRSTPTATACSSSQARRTPSRSSTA